MQFNEARTQEHAARDLLLPLNKYDKDSFRVWRDCHKAFGDYDRLMSEIFSGAEDGIPERILPWTLEDEKLVTQWLEG